MSTTAKDDALGGRAQALAEVIAAPAQIGEARILYSWPTSAAPQWKVLAQGLSANPTRKGVYTELSVQPARPETARNAGGCAAQFTRPPLIEVSTFEGWADVSKVFAPLYSTDGAIAPASPLAAEVASIMAAESTPLGRTQRALELVQDKIRYLAVGINGGNYVPQKPARTWEVRYGDCKAKTLLLLAMLRAMGIEAEPVLAHTSLGDFVPERLPSALAFNHVLVRATIAGEILWLDGTGTGSRLADIHDAPPFRHVLPVRSGGAQLIDIPANAIRTPLVDISVEADESASVELPSLFAATAVVRGNVAAMLTIAEAQLGEKERREMIARFFQGPLGEAQLSSARMTTDPASGTVTLTIRGVTSTLWARDGRIRKQDLGPNPRGLQFEPDRSRPAWRAIPVAAPGPGHPVQAEAAPARRGQRLYRRRRARFSGQTGRLHIITDDAARRWRRHG